MAGKRHHIIPRFLMKGFASYTDRDEIFTWVYRKNKSVFESNTKNINIERHFYGKEGEEDFADDVITELERESFSPLVDKLRVLEGSVDFLSPEIADFCSNLIIRTKNFRNSFISLSEDIYNQFDLYLSNQDKLKKLLINQPTLLKNQFDEIWQKHFEPEIRSNADLLKSKGINSTEIAKQKEILFKKLKSELSEQLNSEIQFFTNKFSEYFSFYRENIPTLIKQIHNKHLKQKPISKEKINEYLKLNWFVLNVNEPLILGDAGCIFEVNGKRRFKTFDDTYENLINVFLPISSDKLLVGSKYKFLHSINIKLLNQATAYSSFDLFISSQNTKNHSDLSASIGKWASLVTEEEFDYYMNQMFHDIEGLDSLLKTTK